MASLNPTVALAALADVDVELAGNGLSRDFGLELRGGVRRVGRAAAVGAAVRQRRVVGLVDLFGAGRLAVGLGAVVLTGLAAGRVCPTHQLASDAETVNSRRRPFLRTFPRLFRTLRRPISASP